MSNYTTQTATLKATTIDTRKIDAKQIDTKKLFINGELFDPSQIKESPNDALFALMISDEGNYYFLQSQKTDQDGEYIFESEGYLQKGSETNGVLPNGVYVVIQIDDNFVKCYGGVSMNNLVTLCNITLAKFGIVNLFSYKLEQCIFENFIKFSGNQWIIKICEEDDNLSELYGGLMTQVTGLNLLISIPYYIPENDTSTSTYSLRETNPIDSLRERFEQMRQQSLDNPTE